MPFKFQVRRNQSCLCKMEVPTPGAIRLIFRFKIFKCFSPVINFCYRTRATKEGTNQPFQFTFNSRVTFGGTQRGILIRGRWTFLKAEVHGTKMLMLAAQRGTLAILKVRTLVVGRPAPTSRSIGRPRRGPLPRLSASRCVQLRRRSWILRLRDARRNRCAGKQSSKQS